MHKGQILERVARKKIASMAELARKVNYDRSTLYIHFKDPDLEDHIILKYGKALKYDFSKEFPGLLNRTDLLLEPIGEYRAVTLSEALREADAWKQKYIDLLEKHTELLNSIVKETH